MFRALTKAELNSLKGNTVSVAFDASIKDKLGNEGKYEDYKDGRDYDTQFFELYKDDLYGEAKRLTEYYGASV